MAKFKPVTHIIFDIDGTLIDSETIYARLHNSIAAKFGGKSIPAETRTKMLGLSEPDSIGVLINDLKLNVTVDKFREVLHEDQKKELKNAQLMPGVERLVTHFQKHKIPMACATSSSLESTGLKTTCHSNVFKFIHHIVSGTDDPEVPHSKPAPDIFLVCASRFPECPEPEKCLVFEDAPNGVTAANKAGMQVIMVPDPHLDKNLQKGATIVLESLNDFKPEMFCLPPFSSDC